MTDLRLTEIAADPNHGQSAFVTQNLLAGTRDIGLVRFEDNPAGHYPDPPCADFTVTVQRQGSGMARYDLGAGNLTGLRRRGDITFTAVNQPLDYELDFDFGIDVVALPPALLIEAQEALGRPGSLDTEALHTTVLRDPLIEQLMGQLFAEASAGNPSGATFVDHIAYVLAGSLLRLAGTIKPPTEPARPLNAAELERVTALIEARLDEKLTLTDLAQPVGLDVFAFSRAFRAATGSSPHQYLIGRRVARVRQMLETTADPLAIIAYECGFGSQQHMTATFSKHVGTSPGAYRRARLS